MIDHILGEWSAIQLYNAVMLFRGDDDPSRMTRNHGDSRRDLPRRIIMVGKSVSPPCSCCCHGTGAICRWCIGGFDNGAIHNNLMLMLSNE